MDEEEQMLYGEESVEHEVKADEVDGDNEVNPSENVESGVWNIELSWKSRYFDA